MKFDSSRVAIKDYGLVESNANNVVFGQSFAFLSEKFFKSPTMSWVSTLFGKDSVSQSKILPLIGRHSIELPGMSIKPLQIPRIKLQSISSDKELYEAAKDEVNLLVVSAFAINSTISLNVLMNGLDYSTHLVELDDNGIGQLILRDLAVGQFEVCFEEDDSEFHCCFSVAEYRLVPLVATVVEKNMIDSEKLKLRLKLTSFGQEVNDTVHGQVRTNEIAIDTFKEEAKDGLLDITVKLEGEGPHTIVVQLESDSQKTASVPLTGTRKSERQATLFSPLGSEVKGSLLPQEDSVAVRGIYLESGATITSPITLERVDTATVKLKINSKNVSSLTVVSINVNSHMPPDNDVDLANMIHPSHNCNYYRSAEEEFKKGNHKEALELFQSGRESRQDPHPYYAYFIACCHAKMGRLDTAIKFLKQAIADGWNEFDHMANDNDLDLLKNHPGFKSLVDDDYIVNTFENLKAGETVELKLNSTPVSILSLGAYVDEKPWEGWAAILTPDKLTCKVTPPQICQPGKKVSIEFETNNKETSRVYTIVKDTRLQTGDNPESRLALRIKNVVESSSEALDHGFEKTTLQKVLSDASTFSGGFQFARMRGNIPMPNSPAPGGAIGGAAGWDSARQELTAGDDLSSGAWGAQSAGADFEVMGATWGTAPASPAGPAQMSAQMKSGYSNAAPDMLMGSLGAESKSISSQSFNPMPRQPARSAISTNKLEIKAEPQVLYAGFVSLENGKGTLKINLPEQFGDYLIETFAMVGFDWKLTKTQFTAEMNPYINLTLPTFTRSGELAAGTIYAGNKSSDNFQLELTRDGNSVALSKSDGTIFNGNLKDEILELNFECTPGTYEAKLLDASNLLVTYAKKKVEEPGKLKRFVRSLKLLEAGESINKSDDQRIIGLTLLPGLDNSFEILLQATTSYEHCCCEQTAAKLLSACSMYLLNDSKNGTGDKEEGKKAESIIIAGVKRMETMWLKGRGFKSYPNSGNTADQYYGKQASQYLFNLEFLKQAGTGLSSDLINNLNKGIEMAKDTSVAYSIACPPNTISSCADAYSTLVFGNGNGDKQNALKFVRSKVESAGNLEEFLAKLPDNPYVGTKVNARIEASYAAACLLKAGQPGDKRKALDLGNLVIGQFNEQGNLYSTIDSVAAIALMSELKAARVTGGGIVEVNGEKISVTEAINFRDPIKSVKVIEGVAAVECQKELIEDWSAYGSSVQTKIALTSNGKAKSSFSRGDSVQLEITLEEGYKDGDLLWVCLPDCLSRVIGGGQVKLFSMDFQGESNLSIPLAATGSTGNNGTSSQSYAVCVRNMFNEDRVGSPGLLEVKIK